MVAAGFQPGASFSLAVAALAPATVRKYSAAVEAFKTWVSSYQPAAVLEPVPEAKVWDGLLVEYARHLWAAGRPQYVFCNALFGAEALHPQLRRQLVAARRWLEGWRALEPKTKRPPMPREAAATLAFVAARRLGKPMYGLAVLVAFHGLLRASEVAGLRRSDINIVSVGPDGQVRAQAGGHQARAASASGSPERVQAVLRLRFTKTGTDQSAVVRDPQVAALLRSALASPLAPQDPEAPFFGFANAEQYQRLFQTAAQAAGLGDMGFTPHSLRHGGATYLFMAGVPVTDVVQVGRWRQVSSAMYYIQCGPALLRLQSFGAEQLAAGARLVDGMERFMRPLLQ